jgi:choline kinase
VHPVSGAATQPGERIAAARAAAPTGRSASIRPDHSDDAGVDTTVLVLLGAGKPARGTLPSALVRAGSRRRILDWLLDAFSELALDDVSFVGGYRIDEVAREYPELSVSINRDWRSTGPVGSLMTMRLEPGCTAYVSYTDVVYERDAPLRLDETAGDVVLAMDPGWRSRFVGRPMIDLKRAEKVQLRDGSVVQVGARVPFGDAHGEFMGLVKLGPRATRCLAERREESPRMWARSSLPELLQRFVDDGLDVRAAELPGRWAELNAPQDLARFVLGTKASTLLRLQTLVERSTVPKSISFTADAWETAQETVLADIAGAFAPGEVIVRSSSAREDSWTASNAGAFLSISCVAAADREAVASAVRAVVASYTPRTSGDEVLVQEVIADVAAAGVVMTRNPKTGAPYFVLNLDDVSGRTDAVTAGASGHRTAFVHRADAPELPLPPTIGAVVAMAAEVETLVGHDSLDLEFAVDRDGGVLLLQARPIVSDYRDWKTPDADVAAALEDAEVDLDRIADATPFLVGDSLCLGVMPDWNPAEIVGVKPRRLALSLYQHLITDDVWARQRAEFGYRDVRPCPLVVSLAGQPFVDVRASFNSFVPAALPDALARNLVNHYLEQLHARPELHDKIEFEIALTCKGLDFGERADALLGHALSRSELALLDASLTELTHAAVARLDDHVAACERLRARADVIAAGVADPLDRAFLLLEDCRRIGTLAFAHLARDAFVAMEWLRSLVRRGVLEQVFVDRFLASLHTVSSEFSEDVARVRTGTVAAEDFLGRYGHLRPGTYEITSPCYAVAIEQYLGLGERRQEDDAAGWAPMWWPAKQRAAVEACLRNAGLPLDFATFERFVRTAIEQREGSKFAFTRNLSDALEDLALFGARIGLGREQLSHVRIEDLLRLRRGSDSSVADTLAALSETGERAYRRTLAVELPTLVFGHDDLRAFEQAEVAANFVTTKSVRAPVVGIGSGTPPEQSLEGAIAVIGSADPGYDWLFTRGIAGLVTAYGGVNSHMAIRAAEQALPAAIGVGIHEHDRLTQARVVELDCAARTLRIVV